MTRPVSKPCARGPRSWLDDCLGRLVVKLTRLNQQTITVNPDNILWAEASPDTTLCFLGGEKVLVREGMDELIDRVIAFRRMVSSEFPQSRRDVEG
jgi:flagellar protein FlbD